MLVHESLHLLVDAVEELRLVARGVGERVFVGRRENLLHGPLDDVRDLVGGDLLVGTLRFVLRLDAGFFVGRQGVFQLGLAVRAVRVYPALYGRDLLVDGVELHPEDAVFRVEAVLADVREEVAGGLEIADVLLGIRLGIPQEVVLELIDLRLQRDREVVLHAFLRGLVFVLGDPAFLADCGLVFGAQGLGILRLLLLEETVGRGRDHQLHVPVEDVGELVRAVHEFLRRGVEGVCHLGDERIVQRLARDLLAVALVGEHLVVELGQGGGERGALVLELQLDAVRLELRSAFIHALVQLVEELVAHLSAEAARDDVRRDALAHVGEHFALLFVEEVLEMPETVLLDLLGVAVGVRGRQFEELLDGAFHAALDAVREVGEQRVVCLRVDVVFLEQAVDLPRERADGLLHEHRALAVPEGAVDVARRLEPRHHVVVRLFVDVDARRAARLDGVADLLVEDRRQRAGHQVLVHRHPAAPLVDERDRPVRNLLEELLRVAPRLELEVRVHLRVRVFLPPLSEIELPRDADLVYALVGLLQVGVLVGHLDLVRDLHELVLDEGRREQVELGLDDEVVCHVCDLMRELHVLPVGAVHVQHEHLARPHQDGGLLGLLGHVLGQFLQRVHGRIPRLAVRGRLRNRLLRALDEFLREGEDAVDVELRVQHLLDARLVVHVGELAQVLHALADDDRQHVLEEHLEPGVLVPESEVDILDAGLVEELDERRAHDGEVLIGDHHAEVAVILRARGGDGLELVLGLEAHLRVVHEVLELVEQAPELDLRLDHPLARRQVGVVLLAVDESGEAVVDAVLVGPQVVLREIVVRAAEAALGLRRRHEVLEDDLAPDAVVELRVELLEHGLDVAAAEGLAGIERAVGLLRGDDEIPDGGPGVAHVLEVVLHGLQELRADRHVVRGAHVGTPGKREVDLVVDLLELEPLGCQPEPHVPLVGGVRVVHHVAEFVDSVGLLVSSQLLCRYVL